MGVVADVSRSYSDTPQSVGFVWKRNKPVAGTFICTTHNTHNKQTSMPLAGFEPAIPSSELSQTHALDRAATVIGR